jgi:hypothetical protein
VVCNGEGEGDFDGLGECEGDDDWDGLSEDSGDGWMVGNT